MKIKPSIIADGFPVQQHLSLHLLLSL